MLSALGQLRFGENGDGLLYRTTLAIAEVPIAGALSHFAKIVDGDYFIGLHLISYRINE